MGIFQLLKKCEHPLALKELNQFLNFNARLAEANTELKFIQE